MPRQMVDAHDVGIGSKGWTCIVQVIEKHPVLHKQLTFPPFQKRYMNYLFTDMKGTQIRAVVFDNDIEFFERSLQPFKRYKISNAIANLPPDRYQLPDYKYSWIIKSKTPVEPIIDPQPYILPCDFGVCKFSDLHKFAESDENIVIRGLVVHRFREIEITSTRSAKDYIVVDEEGIPMVIRLWKDLLADYDPDINQISNEPVIILATNVEVNTFHGLALATRPNTYLLQNPPLAGNVNLTDWYAENKDMVVGYVQRKGYKNNPRYFPPPKLDDVLDVSAALHAFANAKTCWVKGKVRLEFTTNPLYYMVCANCQLIVDADLDWDVECSACSVLSPMEARLALPVTLRDETNNIKSTIKSPDADKLCPYPASEVRNLEIQRVSPLNEISIEMDNTELICFIKYYIKRGETTRRFVILKTYTLEEVKAINDNNSAVVDQNDSSPPMITTAPRSSEALTPPSQLIQVSTPANDSLFLQTGTQPFAKPGPSSSKSPVAKRSLDFGTSNEEEVSEKAGSKEDAEIPSSLPSPNKKNKMDDSHAYKANVMVPYTFWVVTYDVKTHI